MLPTVKGLEVSRGSAVDSSPASYLNHDDKYPGRVDDGIDYYDKGMLIACGLNATLRTELPGASLDQSSAAFYQRYAGRGAGYTVTEFGTARCGST
jgi:predicted metalloprotease with PDZ domain